MKNPIDAFRIAGYQYTPAASQEFAYLTRLIEEQTASAGRVVAVVLSHHRVIDNPNFTGNPDCFAMEDRYIAGEPVYFCMTVKDVTFEHNGVMLWGDDMKNPQEVYDYLLFDQHTYTIPTSSYPEVTIYIETKQ